MKGYYQLIEGHGGGFVFTLKAGNHETVLQSTVYWSRQAALDAATEVRHCSQDASLFQRHEAEDGNHYFLLLNRENKILGRSADYNTRGGLNTGIASVQRNGPAETFRGLVRRSLTVG